ncbi:hypothetical protein INR49_019610, partial [Caranx melampygus]
TLQAVCDSWLSLPALQQPGHHPARPRLKCLPPGFPNVGLHFPPMGGKCQRPEETFRLRLRRNAAAFSPNFMVVSENGSTSADLSHLYSGILEVLPPIRSSPDGFCAAEHLNVLAQSLRPKEEAAASRSRRTVDESKTSCLLHLHVDHLYYKKFKSVEAVVAQVSSYIRAVNDIYDKVDFDGIKLINFRVKSLSVMTEEDKNDRLNPLYIGPETLLTLYSEKNWGNFCLSYLLTNRDYSGVLGLAWEGKAGNWGGICSKETTMRNGQTSTLNTGLVTIQNFGQFLPARLVQLTFAHELGHSLGSPHDEGSNCGNLGSAGGKGRYLMFPHATDEVRENNEKFSHCSIEHISKILKLKKDDCFVVSNLPICGNQIVEKDEECDVGHNDTDPCCFSAKKTVGVQCRLKPGKVCSCVSALFVCGFHATFTVCIQCPSISPSQGLCCSQDCGFKPLGQTCDEETDCLRESVCSGLSPLCPEPSAKENFTICSQGTRVCLNGPETCASTASSVLSRHFQRKAMPLVGGAPCSGNRGYCDKFHVCRLLDADGPIARLKNSILHFEDFNDVAEWMKAHWWAILLAILTMSGVMGCTICLCGRRLDTSILN